MVHFWNITKIMIHPLLIILLKAINSFIKIVFIINRIPNIIEINPKKIIIKELWGIIERIKIIEILFNELKSIIVLWLILLTTWLTQKWKGILPIFIIKPRVIKL